MSGFFALRRSTYLGAQRLTPLGYKIGLELICKCRVQKVKEVPIHFAERVAGESKLSLKQQFRYLEHLSRLYDFCFPRLSPMVKFAIVTLASWLVGFALFLLYMRAMPQAAIAPTCIAYFGAIGVTMVFHARYVRTQREFLVRQHPWMDFIFSSLAEWALCSLAAVYLGARVLHPYPLELFLIPFALATMLRYILRKEFLLDLRGLRREIRLEEIS
jgi:dolichol-phosphate mannosyltransferase